MKWFSETFEAVGRISVEEFAQNYRRLIPLIQAETGGARAASSTASRSSRSTRRTTTPCRNLQSALAPRRFNIALAELSRELGLPRRRRRPRLKEQGVERPGRLLPLPRRADARGGGRSPTDPSRSRGGLTAGDGRPRLVIRRPRPVAAPSLPFDRAGRLGGHVVRDTVHAGDLPDDAPGDACRAPRAGAAPSPRSSRPRSSRPAGSRGARSVRPSPITPTLRTSARSTQNACQVLRSSPARRISSRDDVIGRADDRRGSAP